MVDEDSISSVDVDCSLFISISLELLALCFDVGFKSYNLDRVTGGLNLFAAMEEQASNCLSSRKPSRTMGRCGPQEIGQ
jgi:hypothetical protein